MSRTGSDRPTARPRRAAGAATPLRLLAALGRADFLERARRFSTLVTFFAMLFMAWQAMPADPRQFSMSLRLGDYRGLYNSAWVGGLMAMLVTTLLTLVGFYLVKNAVERDRLTGVGEILATTPIRRFEYTLGKTLSNFIFLAALPATLWVAGLGMQLLRGEDRRLDPLVMALPLALMCLPALAVVAAVAVLFECLAWLRGTLGNVVYFLLWNFTLVSGVMSPVDLLGMRLLQRSMAAACQARYPDYSGQEFVIGGGIEPVRGTFVWDGVDWSGAMILGRLAGFAVALLVALLASLAFDRFDPSRGAVRVGARGARPRKGSDGDRADNSGAPPGGGAVEAPAGARGAAPALPVLTPLTAGARHVRIAPLVRAELKVLFHGVSRWWGIVFLALVIAGLAVPGQAGTIVRGIAWIWPLGLWSGLGVRDLRHGTRDLLLSSPGPRSRQWPATLLAGVLLALLPGVGSFVHGVAAHGAAGGATVAAGILFVPIAAFASGRLSGSSRLFEAGYLLLWYVGPMNSVPMFDYTAGAPAGIGFDTAAGFLAAGALLLAAAALLRDDRR